MIKQPKYFISKDRPVKPSGGIRTIDTPEEIMFAPVDELAPQDSHPRRKQAILLGLSALSVVVLTSMGVLSTVKAKQGSFPLPSLLPSTEESKAVVTADTGSTTTGLSFDVKVADARVEIVRAFLSRHNSPLTPHDHIAKELVAAADRYGLDYRLMPAIMMQESNLGKTSKPELKNPFGFGIHKNGELGFDTYEAGFDRVARELKERYIDIGLVTPEQIERKYTPSSNGSWSNSVNQWIAEMEHNDREAGKENESDADLLEYVEKK